VRAADRVAEVLRARIAAGEWAVDERLPSEPALAAELGVSRQTLRQALERISDEGLVVRLHGRGTFVLGAEGGLPLAQRFVTLSSLLRSSGLSYDVDVLANEIAEAPPRVAAALHASGEPVFHVRRRLRVAGRPHAVLDNWVPLRRCPRLPEVDFASEALFDGLERLGGVTVDHGRRSVEAVAEPDVADLLGLAPEHPLLHIEQVTFDAADQPVEFSHVWLLGGGPRLTTVLARDPGRTR
jgi:GntR family transcriptional regulator